MTDAERTLLAEQLFAVIIAQRPAGEAGQAWVLTIVSMAVAQAVLASVGPHGDAEPLLVIVTEQVRSIIATAQSTFFRDRLTAVPGHRPA